MALSSVGTVVFGVMTKQWFWAFFFLICIIIVVWVVSSILREYINENYRSVHFLMAVGCRAHNNKNLLHHGVELRPGYLGKFIEVIAI